MFSRIIETLRNNSSIGGNRSRNTSDANVDRRSSAEEDNVRTKNPKVIISKTHSATSASPLPYADHTDKATTSPPGTVDTVQTTTYSIKGLDPTGVTDAVYIDGRRRSSFFGYSANAADDYMQKDLLSSSWS